MESAKLRVAHIITLLELGGAQQNTLYTVAHLDRNTFVPCLLTGPGGYLDKDRRSGVKTYFVASLMRPVRPLQDILALINIYQLLRHIKPHIVHTHSSKAGILGRLAAYIAGVPVIIHTFHGFGFNNRQKTWIRRLFVAIEKFCALLTTHLVFVAEENRREARQLGIGTDKPSSLIRSGVKFLTRRKSDIRRELQIPPNSWIVASVGNFKPQKNPMALARVAVDVLAEDPAIHFLVVGDGELRRSVVKWLRNKPGADQIHFLGWRRDVHEILVKSDAFLLTSLWEGLPRSLVEAFAAGLPAVVYDVDGVRDIMKNSKNGFLIEPEDFQSAKEKLLWLKNHPQEAKQMGQCGQELVQKEFDIDRMVQQQEELYKKLWEEVPLKDYYHLPQIVV